MHHGGAQHFLIRKSHNVPNRIELVSSQVRACYEARFLYRRHFKESVDAKSSHAKDVFSRTPPKGVKLIMDLVPS
jgi:hypothetical protein